MIRAENLLENCANNLPDMTLLAPT